MNVGNSYNIHATLPSSNATHGQGLGFWHVLTIGVVSAIAGGVAGAGATVYFTDCQPGQQSAEKSQLENHDARQAQKPVVDIQLADPSSAGRWVVDSSGRQTFVPFPVIHRVDLDFVE